MITRDEAVKKIAREGIEHAEELYDSIINKPAVTQYVADWVDNSREYDYDFDEWFDCSSQPDEIYKWLNCENKRQSELNALALATLIVNGRDAVIVEKEPRYTVSDLITKINHWADERNLKQADPKIQWMRVTEEVGEIRDVLLKPTKFTGPQMALKDAIGDTLVTIIVLAHQLDLDVTECLNIAYEEIKNRKGKIVNGTFVKESDL